MIGYCDHCDRPGFVQDHGIRKLCLVCEEGTHRLRMIDDEEEEYADLRTDEAS